jgi:XTP/dITP diphosphohydrolase
VSGPLRLVLASANQDKAAEIRAILVDALGNDVEVVARPPEIPEVVEDGDTLHDNARLKAEAVSQATGQAAVADDTGLEVDALDGAPGVYSARFAGDDATYADNVAKLLTELERVGAVSAHERRARFRTVALVRFPGGTEVAVEGVVEGTIADTPRGNGGFGYDPVFIPHRVDDLDAGDLAAGDLAAGDDLGAGDDDVAGARTFAEMDANDKHAVSHRGRAFRALAQALASRSD